jgi:hypothetical protein
MRSPEQHHDAAPTGQTRAANRRVSIVVAAVLLFTTVVGVAITRTRHEADARNADLQRVNHTLDEERVAVAAAAQRRRDAEAVLGRVLDRLEHERSDRSDVRSLYEVISAQLKAKLDELETTSENLELRARQLDQLNQCLTGVAAAMKLAAYDADSRVLETLDAVADVCASARGLTTKGAG